jgi:hypothetical protein
MECSTLLASPKQQVSRSAEKSGESLGRSRSSTFGVSCRWALAYALRSELEFVGLAEVSAVESSTEAHVDHPFREGRSSWAAFAFLESVAEDGRGQGLNVVARPPTRTSTLSVSLRQVA